MPGHALHTPAVCMVSFMTYPAILQVRIPCLYPTSTPQVLIVNVKEGFSPSVTHSARKQMSAEQITALQKQVTLSPLEQAPSLTELGVKWTPSVFAVSTWCSQACACIWLSQLRAPDVLGSCGLVDSSSGMPGVYAVFVTRSMLLLGRWAFQQLSATCIRCV